MVAPEPGETLLLYIAATSETVSMVAERPDPHDLHELGRSSTDGSGSQDPGPTEEIGAADGSRSSDPGLVDEPRATDRSQSSEAAMGPLTRESRGPQVPSSRQAQRAGSSLGLHRWKWTCRTPSPPPLGGPELSNVQCTSSARSSMKPRQGTWRSTSCFMQSSSPPESYATASRLRGSQW
jgi:hypothetical protein